MSQYMDLLNAVEQYYGSGSDEWAEIAKYGIASDKAAQILKQVPGVDIVLNANGSVRSYNYTPIENITSTAEQAVNSNVPSTIKSFEIPSNSGIETVTSETGEAVKQMTFKSGMKQAGSFVFGEVAPRVAAVATGITLGKVIDKALYNFDPDFWDEKGMSTLNPDVWGDIIGTDSAGGKIMNMILGTTPDGKTQAYIDQNALAYMALYENNKGVFNVRKTEISPNDYIKENNPDYANAKVYATTGDAYGYRFDSLSSLLVKDNESEVYKGFASYINEKNKATFASLKPFKYTVSAGNDYYNADIWHYNNKEYYYGEYYTFDADKPCDPEVSTYTDSETNRNFEIYLWAYIALFGNKSTIGGIDGIGTQEGAKTPDLSDDSSVEDTLNALKEQFPELWDNAVEQDVVQPDGSVKTYVYVPVALPDIDDQGNPVSSSSTQKDPQIDPATYPESLLDVITKIIQRDPPVNPPDTGSGVTPIVPPSSGSASALYMIYNPTLAQINSFGAWLWSDNFVDQIKKLFNDPMQAIIGLHKVYATPSTGGTQTIKVGYLDSGVSARVVSNQYTTIDCGTVSLSEQFYNVFDYSPYTEVSLYLPFIGIVNINVSDVMRSAIHIVYHVDVLSGACLAEVKVTRDSAGGTLYQYAGNASVTLPISSGSYMGIVSAVAGVAGGIAGTIASGGSALPLIASSAGAMFNAHTRVEHSGGFSGNAGAMGGKIPYLIISRPQTEMAEGFENYIGYPSNFTATIGSCTGFIKVIECHVENANATNSELTEINTMLQEGVIV